MENYQNSFYCKTVLGSTPVLSCNMPPVKYKGHLIYHRQTNVFDIVKNGVCIGMFAGMNGAKKRIDELIKFI